MSNFIIKKSGCQHGQCKRVSTFFNVTQVEKESKHSWSACESHICFVRVMVSGIFLTALISENLYTISHLVSYSVSVSVSHPVCQWVSQWACQSVSLKVMHFSSFFVSQFSIRKIGKVYIRIKMTKTRSNYSKKYSKYCKYWRDYELKANKTRTCKDS